MEDGTASQPGQEHIDAYHKYDTWCKSEPSMEQVERPIETSLGRLEEWQEKHGGNEARHEKERFNLPEDDEHERVMNAGAKHPKKPVSRPVHVADSLSSIEQV